MLKFTSIVGYTSCGPMYIESFLTIFGQCINVLNYKYKRCVLPFSYLISRVLNFAIFARQYFNCTKGAAGVFSLVAGSALI